MVQRLAAQHPDKTIVSLDPLICPCSTMFRIDGPHLAWVLENLVAGEVVNQIVVDADDAEWATRRARSGCSTSPDAGPARHGLAGDAGAAGAGSSARVAVLLRLGEEAFGRRRLLHALDQQAVLGHRVHVLRQRPVHERQHDARRELLHRDVGDEVRADAPVLLVEDRDRSPSRCSAPAAAGG